MKKISKVLVVSASLLVGTSSIPVPSVGIKSTEASTSVVYIKIKYQTTANLSMREGAGTSYKQILLIPKGAVVLATQRYGSWYKVSYTYQSNGVNVTKSGWVSGAYLKEYYKYSSQSIIYFFTNKTANLYPTPDTKNKAAYSIPINNGFTSTQNVVNSIGQTWYRVYYQGKYYYIYSGDITKSALSTFSTTQYKAKIDANLYQSYGTIFSKLVTIPNGTVISTNQRVGHMYKVTYAGKTGYINIADFEKYAVKYEATTTAYYFTNKTAGLYATPDATKPEITSVEINNGFASTQKAIDLTGKTWYRVSFNGQNLYVKSEDVKADITSTFKQTNYQATRDSYVYESYGTAFKKLVTIPKDAILQTSNRVGLWYKVTYNGFTGYINGADFAIYNGPKYEETTTAYYFTNKTAKLYATPDATTPELYTIDVNNGFASTQKAIDPTGKTWYRVSYNGQNVYVKSEDVNADVTSTFKQTNYKAIKETYVYESYGTTFKKLVTISQGTVLPTTYRVGLWYKVTFDGVTGYINRADFEQFNSLQVEPVANKTYVNTTVLSLRQTYDPDSPVLIEIPISEILVVTEKVSNGWYKTSYNGRTGYVLGSYIKEVVTGAPLNGDRNSYQFIDLRTQSPVTAQQINDYIAKNYKNTQSYEKYGVDSVLLGQGQNFIDAGKQYGVNPLYLAAHAIHESDFGTSAISVSKNNLFGFGSYDATAYIASYKFDSVKDNIFFIAREMKHTYLNDQKNSSGSYIDFRYKGAYLGFSTKIVGGARVDGASEGMNFYYASDPLWGKGIVRHMQNILAYDQAYYSSAPVNREYTSRPSKPAGSDVFPANIIAINEKTFNLYTSKGGTTIAKTIAANTQFQLLEKTNDYWIKINLGGTIYWTNSVKFDVYNQYLSVYNLGRSKTEGLKVRSTAVLDTTDSNVITKLKLNEYVSIVRNSDGTLVTSGDFYQIKLADGRLGWVSKSYIIQELR